MLFWWMAAIVSREHGTTADEVFTSPPATAMLRPFLEPNGLGDPWRETSRGMIPRTNAIPCFKLKFGDYFGTEIVCARRRLELQNPMEFYQRAKGTRRKRLSLLLLVARVQFARNLPLPPLATVSEHATFVGHDSGNFYLAASAGAKCILLFGPADPDVWTSMNKNVNVLRVPSRKVNDLG